MNTIQMEISGAVILILAFLFTVCYATQLYVLMCDINNNNFFSKKQVFSRLIPGIFVDLYKMIKTFRGLK